MDWNASKQLFLLDSENIWRLLSNTSSWLVVQPVNVVCTAKLCNIMQTYICLKQDFPSTCLLFGLSAPLKGIHWIAFLSGTTTKYDMFWNVRVLYYIYQSLNSNSNIKQSRLAKTCSFISTLHGFKIETMPYDCKTFHML